MNKSIFEFLRAVDKVCSAEQKAQIMKELNEEKQEKKDTCVKIQVSNTDVEEAFANASYEALKEISTKVNLKKENDNIIVVAILK